MLTRPPGRISYFWAAALVCAGLVVLISGILGAAVLLLGGAVFLGAYGRWLNRHDAPSR